MALNLASLRNQPKATCDGYGFLVKNSLYRESAGGPCSISLSKLEERVYKLEPVPGAGDWFFPYARELGTCSVPIGRSEGTIVFTGGMNGCALEVYRNAGNFDFYHDTNGRHLAARHPAGERVCRCDPESYTGPLRIGDQNAKKLMNSGQGLAYFEHTLIGVRGGGRWMIFVTGVISYGKKTKYEVFRPTYTSLLTSFEDS